LKNTANGNQLLMTIHLSGLSTVQKEERFLETLMIRMIFLFFLELSSIEKGKKLAQSDSLKEAMQEAGVISMPEIYFIEEVATTSK
jgi:hypothetical protein